MLKVIKQELQKIVNNIDTGNSNLSNDEMEELLDILIRLNEDKLSKYQAMKYVNCSRASFDEKVRKGELPRGKKQIGFKELFWSKKDLDDYIKKQLTDSI